MNKFIKILFLSFFISSLFIISSCVESKKSFTMDDLTVTYDGKVHSLKVNEELPEGTTVTYENNDQTEVGTYIVIANISSANDNGSSVNQIKATLTITKATYDMSNIKFEDKTVVYDGNEHFLEIEGTLPDGVRVEYSENHLINAGSILVTARFKGDSNHEDIPSVTATLTITKATYDMSNIKFEDKTVVYDGNEHFLEIEGTLPEGVRVEYSKNHLINAGSILVTASFKGDSNHEDIPNKTATLTITKATYDMSNIKFEDKTVVYDGNEHFLEIEGTLPEGVRVEYSKNHLINAGSILVTARFIENATNEEIESKTATLTITKATITGISFNSKRVLYDETEWFLEIEGTLPEGVTVSYLNNGQTEIGSYEVIAEFSDTTGNYYVPEDMTATLEIYTDQIFCDVSFIYPDKEETITYIEGTIVTDLPEIPKKKGYTGHWDYDFTKPIIEDITCNIIYVLEEYQIIYHLNDGTNNEANVTSYTVLDQLTLLDPVKVGYIFVNWYFDEGFTKLASKSYDDHTGDMNLYAKWAKTAYTINYHLNNQIIYTEEIAYGTSFTIKSFEIENHQVFSWKAEESVFIVNGTYQYQYGKDLNLIVNEYLYSGADFTFTCSETTAEITGYSGNTSDLVIPNQIMKDNTTYLVTSIKDEAFLGNLNLTRVIIPESVKSIGKDAFKDCSNLTSITIPFVGNQLNGTANTHFGYIFGADSYFDNKSFIPTGLEEVIITGGKTINDDAFYDCSSLTSITLPSSIKNINFEAFYKCNNLTNVYYKGTIADWCKITFSFYSNPMYYASHFYLKNSADEWQEVTEIEIPDTVIVVSDYQFYGFENLTSITLPSSVETINYGAIDKSTNLTDVYYNGTIEDWCKISFGYMANPMIYASNFYLKDGNDEWSEVTEIEVPSTITNIGLYQFYGFEDLKSVTLPETITEINYQAFANCSNLTSIIISAGTTKIFEDAFQNCTKLTSITLPASVKDIEKNAFSNCKNLTNCYYDGTIEDWCQIKFQDFTANPMSFATNFYLKDVNNEWYQAFEIVIPKTITTVGKYQFDNFLNLRSVYYEGTIEDWCKITFNGMYSNPLQYASSFYLKGSDNTWQEVTEIVIPKTITHIGDYQFYGFEGVKKVTISNGVQTIGMFAFGQCFKLSSIVIPRSITSIEGGAFEFCFGIYDVYYEGTADEWANIQIDSSNSNITLTNIYYYAETKPVDDGKYWYYDNGEIKIWH